MVLHCINLVYVLVIIHTLVVVLGIVQVLEPFATANIQVVIAQLTMFGVVARVYVTVISNIVVAELVTVREVV